MKYFLLACSLVFSQITHAAKPSEVHDKLASVEAALTEFKPIVDRLNALQVRYIREGLSLDGPLPSDQIDQVLRPLEESLDLAVEELSIPQRFELLEVKLRPFGVRFIGELVPVSDGATFNTNFYSLQVGKISDESFQASYDSIEIPDFDVPENRFADVIVIEEEVSRHL